MPAGSRLIERVRIWSYETDKFVHKTRANFCNEHTFFIRNIRFIHLTYNIGYNLYVAYEYLTFTQT